MTLSGISVSLIQSQSVEPFVQGYRLHGRVLLQQGQRRVAWRARDHAPASRVITTRGGLASRMRPPFQATTTLAMPSISRARAASPTD